MASILTCVCLRDGVYVCVVCLQLCSCIILIKILIKNLCKYKDLLLHNIYMSLLSTSAVNTACIRRYILTHRRTEKVTYFWTDAPVNSIRPHLASYHSAPSTSQPDWLDRYVLLSDLIMFHTILQF